MKGKTCDPPYKDYTTGHEKKGVCPVAVCQRSLRPASPAPQTFPGSLGDAVRSDHHGEPPVDQLFRHIPVFFYPAAQLPAQYSPFPAAEFQRAGSFTTAFPSLCTVIRNAAGKKIRVCPLRWRAAGRRFASLIFLRAL